MLEINFDQLLRAGEKCCKGGRWKSATQMFEMDILQNTANLKKRLDEGTFKPKPTRNFTISERGKARKIKAHHITDRQAYKYFCEVELKPKTENLIMHRNSASQPGKGTDFAIKQFRKDFAHAYKVCGGRDFYVKIYDFSDYFGSIPHDLVIPEVGANLSNWGKAMLQQYVNVFPNNHGVGIGGEPSQVIAITFPHRLDRMIACEPGVIASGRYMDDGYVVAKDKETLTRVEEKFFETSSSLGLTPNSKRTRVYNTRTDTVTFLKKRTRITETGEIVMRVTRKNITSELRRMKYQKKMLGRNAMPMSHIKDSQQSYVAYISDYKNHGALGLVKKTYNELFKKDEVIENGSICNT